MTRPAFGEEGGGTAEEGYIEVISLLLKKGADIDWQDIVGDTALISAAKNEHVKAQKLLVKARANVNAKNKH